MNETAFAFIEKVTENAEEDLKTSSRLDVTWHLVKDDMSYSMNHTINSDEDAAESETTIKLAAEWVEPEYAVQIMNIEMMGPKGDAFEALATICFLPDEPPLAWISKVTRLRNGQVAFITPWVSRERIPLSGVLYSPFEKLTVTPSNAAIETVRKLLGINKQPMLKVV
jgi:hypothetical protein